MSAVESHNIMINEDANAYSEIAYVHAISYCGLPPVEAIEEAMKSLDEDSALGPNLVPTRILKRCAKVLAPVLHMLILVIFISENGQR